MVDAAAADGEISPPPSTDGASGLLRRLSVSSLQFLVRPRLSDLGDPPLSLPQRRLSQR